jgi:hypothetical protein
MTYRLTCKQCETDLVGASEDELVDVAQRHAQDHGHTKPLPREHLLTRIRRSNPAPESPAAPPSS